jgi:uroporphyrinogen III methyltransferase/synthase
MTPLLGRTVLVTRPRAQSQEIASLLENLGARVLYLPTIQIVEPESWSELDGAIEKLRNYNWIIFTSSNGVAFFFRRLGERGQEFPAPGPAVCAIGPATDKALQELDFHSDLVAQDSKAEGVLCALSERMGGADKIRGLRFLIPRARLARDILPKELARLGAAVDVVEAYQNVRPDLDSRDIERLFREQNPDAVTFTSSSTVSNLASLAARQDLSRLLGDAIVACIGPVTAACAHEHGLENIVQPQSYNAAALVEAIVEALRKPEGAQ